MKKLFLLVLFMINMNYSWAVQCSEALIDEGDSESTVLSKCGDPQEKNT